MSNRIETGDTVKILRGCYEGQICEVLGFNNEWILVQLDHDLPGGHDGNDTVLADRRKTKEMNLSNVYWMSEQQCEIVNSPKYQKGKLSGIIIRFENDATSRGKIIYLGNYVGHNRIVGETYNVWNRDNFTNLTIEEYEKYEKYVKNKPKSDYPCYMIANIKSTYPGYIVKFTDYGVGSVVYSNNSIYNEEHSSISWCMCVFDKITEEEYENIKKEKNKMKYRSVKTMSGEILYKDRACRTELEKWIEQYGLFNVVEWTKEVEEYVEKQDGWISFLDDHKFIEAVRETYIHKFKCSDKITLSTGKVLVMYQIDCNIGMLFEEGETNRYTDVEYELNNKEYNLKSYYNEKITHINGIKI